MRRASISLAFALAAAALAAPSPCLAEDLAPPAAKWVEPPFDRDTIAMREGDAPEGWRILPEADTKPAAETEIHEAWLAAVTATAFPGDQSGADYKNLVGPGDAPATVAYVGFYKDPVKVAPALKEAAAKKGWVVKDVSSPARLIVISAPEAHREKLTAHALRMAAKRIALAAAAAVGQDRDVAVALAKSALAMEPKAAAANLAIGLVSQPEQNGAPAAAWEPVVKSLRAAVAADAVFPLDAEMDEAARGSLGLGLLSLNGGEVVDKEARDHLKKAWEAGHKRRPEGGGILARYNLACAHSRLKEKDAAFEHLTGVIEAVAKFPDNQLYDAWRADTDFANLRDDPRWKALEEKYPKGGNEPK
jgi:hypothetical protein